LLICGDFRQQIWEKIEFFDLENPIFEKRRGRSYSDQVDDVHNLVKQCQGRTQIRSTMSTLS